MKAVLYKICLSVFAVFCPVVAVSLTYLIRSLISPLPRIFSSLLNFHVTFPPKFCDLRKFSYPFFTFAIFMQTHRELNGGVGSIGCVSDSDEETGKVCLRQRWPQNTGIRMLIPNNIRRVFESADFPEHSNTRIFPEYYSNTTCSVTRSREGTIIGIFFPCSFYKLL